MIKYGHQPPIYLLHKSGHSIINTVTPTYVLKYQNFEDMWTL